MCVCALSAIWTYVQEGALSDRDSYWWVMVCAVCVACVSVSVPSERSSAVWVLLSRGDRDRRAERCGVVTEYTYI